MCLDLTAIDRLQSIGGAVLVRRMIEAYLRTTPERLAEAEGGWASGDLETLERAAHSMKSSSANFGATQLVDLTTQIEHLAAGGETQPLDSLMSELPGAFEKVRRRLLEIDQGLTS